LEQVYFPIVNAKQMKNRNLNPSQPSPIETRVDFNITFYKSSSMTIKYYRNPPFAEFCTGRFSVIDFSNSPVGRIEYIKQSTGSETAKTFTYFMFGFFWAGLNLNSSHYNESTGIGYITGTDSFLFYFGL
jgi:hypothetical protein